jgi:hypothetical protein
MGNWPALAPEGTSGLPSWAIQENQLSATADMGVDSVGIKVSSVLAVGHSQPHMLGPLWQLSSLAKLDMLSSFSNSASWASKFHQLDRARRVNGTGSHAPMQMTVSSHIWVHLLAI